MQLIDAFDRVARYRPTWMNSEGWREPFVYNRAHCLRLLGDDTDVRNLTKSDLFEMRYNLLDEPGQKGTRSHGGVNRIMSMLQTLLNDLVEMEYLDKAPRIRPLKENNTRRTFYTRQQIERMVKVAREDFRNNDIAEAILFAVFTGCRQGEQLDLRVSDVDLTSKLLTFRDTKNSDDHIIDIHPKLEEMWPGRINSLIRASLTS